MTSLLVGPTACFVGWPFRVNRSELCQKQFSNLIKFSLIIFLADQLVSTLESTGYARMLESPIMICRRTVREVFLARECRRTDLSKFRRNITRTFSIVFSVKVCIKRSDCSTVVRDIELVDVGVWWNGMCAPLMMIKEILWLDTSLPHEVRCLLQLPCRFRRSLTLCAYVFHQYLFPPSPVWWWVSVLSKLP